MKDLGEKLRISRKLCGFSQEYVAEKVDVTRQTISNWENNRSQPKVGQLKFLSEIYGVEIGHMT
ncbi:helix-turn-helix transcriptional regulator [Hutsoniella sourekii]